MRNFCGLTYCNTDQSTFFLTPQNFQLKTNYQPFNPSKVSVKYPQNLCQKQMKIRIPTQNQQFNQHIPHYSQSLVQTNQTQYSNRPSVFYQPQKVLTELPHNISLKTSIIDEVSDRNIIIDSQRMNNIAKYPTVHKSYHQFPHPKISWTSTTAPISTQNTNTNMNHHFQNMVKQNVQLKRIIQQEYLPLKQMYEKLKQEHFDQQFLISQLEWKVKQLATELKNKKL